MILICITLLLCSLILIAYFYRRPLKYSTQVKHVNKHETRPSSSSSHSSHTDIFKRFPIFFSVRPNAHSQENSTNFPHSTQNFQKGELITQTCLIKSGIIDIFYKQEKIAVKKAGSLLYSHKQFENKDIRCVVSENCVVYLIEHEVNTYVKYLMYSKAHVNLFCNFFKQMHILYQYEKDFVKMKGIVNKYNIKDIILFMNSFKIHNNSFESNAELCNEIIKIDFDDVSATVFKAIRGTVSDKIVDIFKLNVNDRQINFCSEFKLFYLSFDQVLKSFEKDLECVFVVLHGKLIINFAYQSDPIFLACNDMFGYFNALFNLQDGYEIKAKENTLICIFNTSLLRKYGFKPEKISMEFLSDVNYLFSLINYSTEWIRLEPGQCFEDKDDPNEHVYIIDDGKLKLYSNTNKAYKKYKNIEITRGCELGKKEILTEVSINEKYISTKTTDIIKVHKNLILYLMNNCNSFCIEYTKGILKEPVKKKCKTVVVNLSDEQVHSFPVRLQAALPKNTLYLTYKKISSLLGSNMFDTLGELKFMEFINRKQRMHSLIIIILENKFSGLEKNIVNFCDLLLLTGHVDIKEKLYCDVELVKLYQTRADDSKRDFKFFNINRYKKTKSNSKDSLKSLDKPSVNSSRIDTESLNLQQPRKTFNSVEHIANENLNTKGFNYNKIHHVLSPSNNHFCMKDFERLCRSLMDKRIGLVLSGGGARGLAHIGIIQALEEEGIPIDVIGGTSMGAFIGGLYARKCDNISVFRDAKNFCKKMTSKWRQILDLTYPICSLFTGYAFNRVISSIFKDTKIDDLWIEYFCATTNITTFEEMIHRKGSLWRYIRASMSLAGYLPPLCDPVTDSSFNFLLDGGYVNNVPTDAMLDIGVDKVIAVDVGSSVVNNHYNYGDSLNGFSCLFNRFFKNRKYLTINEIQYRLAYLTTQKKMKYISKDKIILLRPEIEDYKTLDFNKFEEIVACGYSYGKKMISLWKENDEYKEIIGMKSKAKRRYSV